MPQKVRRTFGAALYRAQLGGRHIDSKPLSGFGGASVLEVVENFDTDAYRAVYTVQFAEAIYVLHVFQKKSRSGISTPQADMTVIRTRLKHAEEMHQETMQKVKQEKNP